MSLNNDKIILIGDQHWGVRSDSGIASAYLNKFYSEIFFPYIDKHNIDTIISLGDLVDRRKYINYITASNLDNNFMQPIFDRKLDAHFILGNHDVFYKNTNKQNAVSQLYEQSPINIYVDPKEVIIKGIKFLMLPWICEDNYEISMKFAKTSDAEIVISHLELAGFEMDKGNIKYDGMDKKIFERFNRVYSGHFHHKSTIDNITYLGAPAQYTWIDYDDPKGFHVLDAKTREIEWVKNPFQLFKKFIYNDKHVSSPDEMLDFNKDIFSGTYTKIVVKNKSDPYLFDMVVAKIEDSNPADLQIVEDFLDIDDFRINSEDIEGKEDNISFLKRYVKATESSIDKEKLETFLTSLYVEALNQER